jgi:chemotaxis family two-component system response regulator Rcp1
MELGSIPLTRSRLLLSSSASIAPQNLPVPASGSRFGRERSSSLEAVFGCNPGSDKDPLFSSPLPTSRDEQTGNIRNKAHILLVEDNPADVNLVREAIGEHGVDCELSVITDGAEAIAFMDHIDATSGACPNLIVLDLNLPKCTGLEVLKRIRESGRCTNARVVILSSSDAKSDRIEALNLGANRYIQKPSNLEEFLRVGGTLKDMLSEEEK